MATLKEWLAKATTEQKNQLAEAALTSVPSLRLAAHGYRTNGEVDLTAEFAARIEKALEGIDLDITVRREDMCKACASCPYQLKCNSK